MKIILDCFGGDNCPNSAIDGALLALEENKELEITLCGDESVIGAYLAVEVCFFPLPLPFF